MYIVSKYTQKTMHTIYKDTHEYQCAGSIAHAQMTAYSTQCLEAIYITSKHLHFNPPTPCGVGLPVMILRLLHSSNFNPPTPCGVGQSYDTFAMVKSLISIHPPRVGWDACGLKAYEISMISIHPPRVGWDSYDTFAMVKSLISIHPPRVGWDFWHRQNAFCCSYFNPPTPCGVGPFSSLR